MNSNGISTSTFNPASAYAWSQRIKQVNYEFHENISNFAIGSTPWEHESTGLGPFKTDVYESEDWRDNDWTSNIREALLVVWAGN